MYEDKINQLEARRAKLDEQIKRLSELSQCDDGQLAALTQERLSVYEEISRLRRLTFENDYDYIDIDDE